MGTPADFSRLRRLIDDAITFDDLASARKLASEGYRLAQAEENLGEKMYFSAQMEIAREHFQEAIPLLDKAIAFNPSDGAAYNDRALCMIELGTIDGAMEYFDRGIDVEPDYATIHHNKGWFLNKLGQHTEALRCFQKALELEPDRAVTYENMANVYENMGKPQEAIAAYRWALSLIKARHSGIKKQIENEIHRLETRG